MHVFRWGQFLPLDDQTPMEEETYSVFEARGRGSCDRVDRGGVSEEVKCEVMGTDVAI